MTILLYRVKSASVITGIGLIDLEPLELEYLYTVAKPHVEQVVICDGLFDTTPIDQLIEKYTPDIIVLTGYITQENIMLNTAKQIKSASAETTVIVGGVHAQGNYERFYREGIDIIIHSANLKPFLDIIQLDKISAESLAHIDGICYFDNGNWHKTKHLQVDINALPIADRSYFEAHKSNYRYLRYSPCAIVKTAYSCPYACNFCYCKQLNGGVYSSQSIVKVIDEIEMINCEYIHIVDDTFLVDASRVTEFIEVVIKRKIDKKFIIYSRADFIVKHPELIKRLASIGVVAIIVGIEAVDDETLIHYNKSVSEDINRQSVRILKESGIDCLALFMIGHDAEAKDFDKLYKWVVDAELIYATISIFTPIPGTEIYHQYEDKLISQNIEDWDFIHLVLEPTKMTKREFYYHYYKLVLKIAKIGKAKGLYDFIDWSYFIKLARRYYKELSR